MIEAVEPVEPVDVVEAVVAVDADDVPAAADKTLVGSAFAISTGAAVVDDVVVDAVVVDEVPMKALCKSWATRTVGIKS